MADDPWATQREPDIVVELAAAGFDEAVEIGRGGFGVVYRCLQDEPPPHRRRQGPHL